jgi:adenylate kinase family enzyme
MDPTLLEPPFCLVLVGVPGSGKSTLCADLARDPRFADLVSLSTDDWLEAQAAEIGASYADVWRAQSKQAQRVLRAMLTDAIVERRSIVWDQTNPTLKKRRAILNRIPKESGYIRIAIYFELDDVQLRRNLATRPDRPLHLGIIRHMLRLYVRPSIEEGFDAVFSAEEFRAGLKLCDSSARPEALDQAAGDQAPAVHQDEEDQLERQ